MLPRWDWLSPDIQQKYAGEFVYFIEDAIKESQSWDPFRRKQAACLASAEVLASSETLVSTGIERRRATVQSWPFPLLRSAAQRALAVRGTTLALKELTPLVEVAQVFITTALPLEENFIEVGIDPKQPQREDFVGHWEEIVFLAQKFNEFFNSAAS